VKPRSPLDPKRSVRHILLYPKRGKIRVTVCIAAIGQANVFAASDRMVTSGDIEFEPEQPKIWQLTTAIAIMTAGDISIQTEIFSSVSAEVRRRIGLEPDNWWSLADVADLYAQAYFKVRLRFAEQAILIPLGMNHETYLARNQQLATDLNSRVAEDLVNFRLPPVEAIITGLDANGPHIFVVKNGEIACYDKIGFAAIGIGSGHAESQFMFQRHTRDKEGQETMFLTYSAKKRAEAAPGVGQDTDMVIIGPTLGHYFVMQPEVINRLEEIYKTARKNHDAADLAANDAMRAYVEEVTSANQSSAEQEQAVATIPPDPAASDGDGDATSKNGPKKES
jgi:20S proteasome alpha/beta subunit